MTISHWMYLLEHFWNAPLQTWSLSVRQRYYYFWFFLLIKSPFSSTRTALAVRRSMFLTYLHHIVVGRRSWEILPGSPGNASHQMSQRTLRSWMSTPNRSLYCSSQPVCAVYLKRSYSNSVALIQRMASAYLTCWRTSQKSMNCGDRKPAQAINSSPPHRQFPLFCVVITWISVKESKQCYLQLLLLH